MIVVGGGVIGTEYACMMAALDVKVTLIEGRNEVLGFLDREITEALDVPNAPRRHHAAPG
jgi:NAD(P) transhydrogenase